MVKRLSELPEAEGKHLAAMRCPSYAITPGIPGDTRAADLVMSHISVNFDRTGFQQDSNIVFPIDRLRELAEEGAIGSLADVHYSFMGANAPDNLEPAARQLAPLLEADRVDGVLLVPV